MQFKKYSEIENHYRDKFIEKIKMDPAVNKTWVVTEKVHGANLSIWFNGKEIKFAKRSGWCSDNFYGLHTIKEELIGNVKSLYEYMFLKDSILTIYGEIYGGNYPHDSVNPLPIKAVQKGVFYRPDIGFYVFDIAIDGKIMDYDPFLIKIV